MIQRTDSFSKHWSTMTIREMGPYLAVHTGSTMVVHIPGGLVADETRIDTFLADIALLHTLRVKLVLVAGSAEQINRRLSEAGAPIRPFSCTTGRVTDAATLQAAVDAAQEVKVAIERRLHRGVNSPVRVTSTTSGGGGSSVGAGFGPRGGKLRVLSGNLVTARPAGIVNGVDFENTGIVRSVDASLIEHSLDGGNMVLLTNIGHSQSGKTYKCSSEEVASVAAQRLGASKLIFMHAGQELRCSKTGNIVQHLGARDAAALAENGGFFEYALEDVEAANKLEDQSSTEIYRGWPGSDERSEPAVDSHDRQLQLYFRQAARAVLGGVRRAHLVSRLQDGALLTELFSREGDGILISRDVFEGIRTATASDVPAIHDITQPLMRSGVLLRRSARELERLLDNDDTIFAVVERDGLVVACAYLQFYEGREGGPRSAEVACVASHPDYREGMQANKLLSHLKREAVAEGCDELFALSTEALDWFEERGFQRQSIEALPAERRTTYDFERRPVVFWQSLRHAGRQLDEEELLLGL
jgi:amino-acid N-acetyltransferase